MPRARMKKTSDVPTRIYSYRCLPPVTAADRVEDQFRLASQYRNALVEVERDLRGWLRDVQVADVEVGPVLRAHEEAEVAVEATYDVLRAAKSGVADPDLSQQRDRLRLAKEIRVATAASLREVKQRRKEALLPGYVAARERSQVARKRARASFIDRGLRHGTYTRVEDSVKQAVKATHEPLRFKRYDGGGSIGTQLTATSPGVREVIDADAKALGMTVRELHSCLDTRFRLQALPEDYGQMPRNHRRHAARVRAWLRVGSNADRSPIFAEFPVTFHRPLPSDAVIKWAYVVRRRIGHRLEWRLQLTIESEAFRAPIQPVGDGACAVDLGWRRIFDDEGAVVGLRVGYVVDEQGHEREIRAPDGLLGGMGKVADLASIRDRAFEEARDRLVAWLAGRSLPTWLEEATRSLGQWRAQRKLQVLVDRWGRDRFEGDTEVVASLRAWAKQDRHLQRWQEHQRDRLIAHRRETWRRIAAELTRRYATILIEDGQNKGDTMKLPEIDGWTRPTPEEGDPSDDREQRRMSRLAAPGELRAEILRAAVKRGTVVDVERGASSTQECAWCGCDEPWEAAATIEHTCVSCGRTWDQDANACRNLLHRHGSSSGPLPPRPAEVHAPSKIATGRGTSGSRPGASSPAP